MTTEITEINYAIGCPHIFDGYNYEKTFYEALLPNGEVVYCWPNAGYLVALDNSGRQWGHSDRMLCRKMDEEEYFKRLHAKTANNGE